MILVSGSHWPTSMDFYLGPKGETGLSSLKQKDNFTENFKTVEHIVYFLGMPLTNFKAKWCHPILNCYK